MFFMLTWVPKFWTRLGLLWSIWNQTKMGKKWSNKRPKLAKIPLQKCLQFNQMKMSKSLKQQTLSPGILDKTSMTLCRSSKRLWLMSKLCRLVIKSKGLRSTIRFLAAFNTRSFFNFEHERGSKTTFWSGPRSWWSTWSSINNVS